MDPILRLKGISKRFGGLKALENVDFDLYPGEVHALVGENGAGKSTLMKIFGGVYAKDEGSIRFQGGEVHFSNPSQSMDAGIAIIYQELSALPSLTVIENLYMGRMPTRMGVIDWKRLTRDAREALARVGLNVNPRARMDRLAISQRQLVEIAKAMTKNAKVIVMDEPNSSLSRNETERLFGVIENLKAHGIGIVFISHKLDEVIRIADRITVLRDGHYVGTIGGAEASEDRLIQMMVGRELDRKHVPRSPGTDIVLSVRNFSGPGFEDVSFDLNQGEILCFAGLVGAGRSETMRSLIGASPSRGGEIAFEGKAVRFRSPRQAMLSGIAMLQEDRKNLSLFMQLAISFNMEIGALPAYRRWGILNLNRSLGMAREYAKALSIKTESLFHPVSSLSGGNQQKTIIARWLAVNPKILILDEPTHGVDVGAKSEIYALIRRLADSGMAIILISSELPEVLAMADRVAVMCEGRIHAVIKREEGLDEEKIMRYASGRTDEARAG
ncbi:MAG: sugar ABC transporter ATP-binding protein [Planctomycetota bacterium]|nr:sugar ABC transporter ATP-binding protein [Planctomycetota bacterium]